LELCYEDLIADITHPYSLATDLLQKKLITCEIADAMLSDSLVKNEKVALLIDAIQNAIQESTTQNHIAFNVFLKSLEAHPSHRVVAANLKQVQGEYISW